MKTFRLMAGLGVATVVALATPPARAQSLVSARWLRAHLGRVRVLAVAPPLAFYNSHIPGAALMPLLQADRVAAAALRSLGLGPDQRIVIYQYAGWPIAASRAFVALDALGLSGRVAILDGGWAAWRADGGASQAGMAAARAARVLQLQPRDVYADRAFVAARLHAPGVELVDARLQQYFIGALAEPGEPPGHIPGAVDLPFDRLSTPDGRFLPLAMMTKEFRAAGVTPTNLLIVYCHSGRKAAIDYVAARLLGYRVRIYAGSWRDWALLPPLWEPPWR